MKYKVGHDTFDDIVDAMEHCRSSPGTILRDESGKELMRHEPISLSEEGDVNIARALFRAQLSTM